MRIFLVGFMGCGKSHWGKAWASENSLSFYDLDEQIEKRQQSTIAQLFDHHGEEVFRFLETRALRDIARLDDCIIACGGGTPCFHDNMKWMNERGLTVYFSAAPKLLFDRLEKDRASRPLLRKLNDAELLFYIEHTLNKRRPFYERAGLTLDAAELTSDTFKQTVLPAYA